MLAAVLFLVATVIFIILAVTGRSLTNAALACVALGLALMAGLGDLL